MGDSVGFEVGSEEAGEALGCTDPAVRQGCPQHAVQSRMYGYSSSTFFKQQSPGKELPLLSQTESSSPWQVVGAAVVATVSPEKQVTNIKM